MRITISPSEDIVFVDGTTCRVWDGVTAGGIAVRVYLAGVEVPDADGPAFERELCGDAGPLVDVTERVVVVDDGPDPGRN